MRPTLSTRRLTRMNEFVEVLFTREAKEGGIWTYPNDIRNTSDVVTFASALMRPTLPTRHLI